MIYVMRVSMLLWQVVVGIGMFDSASARKNAGVNNGASGLRTVTNANVNTSIDHSFELVNSNSEAEIIDLEKIEAYLTPGQQLTVIDSNDEGKGNRINEELLEKTNQTTMKDGEGMVDDGKSDIQDLQRDTNATVVSSISPAALSFSACQKLDMALELMTSLDFQEHFQKVFSYTSPYDPEIHASESVFFSYVYILQLIFVPFFIALLLFGANLFLYTFVICAAVIGLFVVFNGVEGVLAMQLDCPTKLSLSVIASFLCALAAKKYFRVGLFALVTLAFGGAAYVIFDTFPHLDPGTTFYTPNQNITGITLPTSDLSTVAWVITIFSSVIGGITLRYFEMAQLEIMTAGMGGVGCAYSLHAFLMIKGKPLDPSVVFLLAFFVSVFGTYYHY